MKNLKLAVPHIVAVVIFFVLASIYFAPHYKGYDLNQHDINQAFGMSKEASDFYSIEKSEPLWTNSTFGGMPAYQIYLTNSSNFFPLFESFLFIKFFGYTIGLLLIAMISFYILLLCFDVDPWLAIVGAIAFGFSSNV